MNDTEKYKSVYEELYRICQKNKWGDPFSYARSREIYLAIELGHQVSSTYSGADGIDKDGNEAEYKSTISLKIKGTYSGISKKENWDQQVQYLTNEKIGKYPYHYFARFDGPIITEIYKVEAKYILDFILPKIKKQFFSKKIKADPRFVVTIEESFIKKYGIKIK